MNASLVDDAPESDPADATSDCRGGLRSLSFLGFLLTQFLGALNDNMFRWLVVPLAKDKVMARWPGDESATSYVLGAGLACFVLPYILFATHAGYLADRFSKRTVTVWCKVAEIAIMVLGIAAIWWGNLYAMFAVVFLMGLQSALFSPSKLGIIPEIVRSRHISSANGIVGLTTVVAVVVGTVAGNWLYTFSTRALDGVEVLPGVAPPMHHLWLAAAALIGVAALGWLASLFIARVPVANPSRTFPFNPFSETWHDLQLLWSDRTIFRISVGIAFFWGLASLAQLNVDTFTIKELGLQQKDVGPLLAILSFGVGLGSVLAGWWSNGRIELGIVPLGAAAIALGSIFLSVTDHAQRAYFWSAAMLFLLGAGGGLFNVPLAAYLQHRSPKESLGAILAAGNFLTFAGMLAVSALFPLLRTGMGMGASEIFLLAGLGTLPVVWYVFFLIPGATIRFLVWLLSKSVYRLRVTGRENLPERGGALLVANHVSWIDGVVLLLTSSRPVRMLAYADYVQHPMLRWLAKIYRVIPIKATEGPKAIIKSLNEARESVEAGELVCIFAEGAITRTGQLQPFQRGLLRIVQGTGAPVVPVYLAGLWGSIFSWSGGKLLWKWPARWPYPVAIHFGKPLNNPDNVNQVRQAVESLGAEAMDEQKSRTLIPPRLFLRQCKASLKRAKIADSSGQELTGGKLLIGSLMFRRLLVKKVLAPDENMVGILLPPAIGGVVANAAVTLAGRVSVNLNYTMTDDTLNYCIKQCGIKHVLTSRRFIEKKPVQLDAELVFLEDLKEQLSGFDKFRAALSAFATPSFILERTLGLTRISPDDLLTVIFTSGSTGEPKGVMLSHHNVGSNISAVQQVFNITSQDVLLGVLPFFHSFGYTGTLWLTLALDPKTVYHYNPLDSRTIGELCGKHGVTIIMATPTFLRGYHKRCTPEQMQKLDLAIVGAEKLPADLAEGFQQKFNVLPTEGYGTTELSPVAAFNVPDHRSGNSSQTAQKLGTVGRVMPGAVAKVVDPDTFADLGANQDGMLLIKGPNVMRGYLNQPEKTAEVIRDGWYITGDIARIDDDGFITITGRQSRFSKIGGEMVPHIRIEELLNQIVEDAHDGEPAVKLAVTAVPHESKGERLVVLHKKLAKPVDQILKELQQSDLPNLWLPSQDSFIEVEEIPLLGTGKLDLRGLKDMALEKLGQKA